MYRRLVTFFKTLMVASSSISGLICTIIMVYSILTMHIMSATSVFFRPPVIMAWLDLRPHFHLESFWGGQSVLLIDTHVLPS
jgi:type IV secretory pathway VirB3-like protein